MPIGEQYQGESISNLRTAQRTLDQQRREGLNMEGMGNDLYTMWQTQFAPMYGGLLASAAGRSGMADQAGIDAQKQYENVRGQMERNASRMGINPNSGRFAGLQQQWGLALAAAKAGAMSKAARDERAGQFTRLAQVLGYGSPLLGAAQTAMTTGMHTRAAAQPGYMRVASEYGDLASQAGSDEQFQRGLQALPGPADAAQKAAQDSNADWYANYMSTRRLGTPVRSLSYSGGVGKGLKL